MRPEQRAAFIGLQKIGHWTNWAKRESAKKTAPEQIARILELLIESIELELDLATGDCPDDRCNPTYGHHVTPHRGCFLR